MLPGFTASLSVLNNLRYLSDRERAETPAQGVQLADLWTVDEHGSHQEPSGATVHCTSHCFCSLFVKWCQSECDNGERSGWKATGGCFGVAGLFWDIW